MKKSTTKAHNDVGINHYRRGEIKEAIKAFTNALKQAKEVISSESENVYRSRETVSHDAALEFHSNNIVDTRVGTEDMSIMHGDFLYPQPQLSPDLPWFTTNRASARRNDMFIFAQPLTISVEVMPNQGSEAATKILFNIALSHHRLGLETGCDAGILHKAVKMYSLAHSLLTSQSTGCPAMLSAILNNLGLVHNILGNLEMASQCFQHLLMVLMCEHVQLNDQLRDQLFQNVLPLILSEQVLAPAAWLKKLASDIYFQQKVS